ncbi:MAG: hypothetical protein J7501_08080 [Bdellovibrio sp.]|nr:hypothetical protein [Bdellovibrio sp.]
MKISSLMLALVAAPIVLATPSQSRAGLGIFEPAPILEKIRKEIAKQDIGASIGLGTDIIDGVNIGLKYKAQTEPSYVDGYYTRLDKYKISANINVGDLVDGGNLPFGFSVEQGTDVYFARQFKKQWEAVKAIPYSLKQVPFSSQKAIQNLKAGDFVALQGKLNIVFSVGGDMDLNPAVGLGGSTHVYMSGEFMIHLFRMPDNKMRVKLITMRSKGGGASASIDYLHKLKIIGLRVIDRHIERWVDLKPVSLNFGKSINDVFMLDYVFNLNNPQAALAFDNFMTKKLKFKDLKVIDPTASRPELQNDILTDMSEVEDMFAADHDLPVEQRRIDRVFKGSNTSLDAATKFKLSMSLVRLEAGTTSGQNKLQNYDRNNVEKQYLLDTYTKTAQSKIFYGIWGEKVSNGYNLIFNSNPQWTPEDFVTVSRFYEARMRNVSRKDFGIMQDRAAKILPASIYRQIDWKNWDFSHGDIVNGYFKHQVCVHPEAFNLIPRYNAEKIKDLFVDFVDSQDEKPPRMATNEPQELWGKLGWVADYLPQLKAISQNFAILLQPMITDQARFNAFRNLGKYSLWRNYGVAFIISQIPAENVQDMITYELNFSGRKVDPISFRYGHFEKQELYNTLMYIQNLINDRSFDLRLVTGSDGNFKKAN